MSKNETVIVNKPSGEKLDAIFEVISKIQKIALAERMNANLPPELLTIKEEWDLFMIGFLKTFHVGLATAMFTPFLVGVVERMVPVFGQREPSSMGVLCSFILAVVFPMVYASIVYNLGDYYVGPYTKKMIRIFLQGVICGALAKIGVVFAGFNFIAKVLLSDHLLKKLFAYLSGRFSENHLMVAWKFAIASREVLVTSAVVVAVITLVIQVLVPTASIVVQVYREHKYYKSQGFPT